MFVKITGKLWDIITASPTNKTTRMPTNGGTERNERAQNVFAAHTSVIRNFNLQPTESRFVASWRHFRQGRQWHSVDLVVQFQVCGFPSWRSPEKRAILPFSTVSHTNQFLGERPDERFRLLKRSHKVSGSSNSRPMNHHILRGYQHRPNIQPKAIWRHQLFPVDYKLYLMSA